MLNVIVLIALVAVGGYDLYLWYKNRPTLSEMYQKLFPTIIDLAIFMIIVIGLCYASFIDYRLRIIIAGICGHVFWPNRERYGEKVAG